MKLFAVCVAVRLLFVVLAWNVSQNVLKALGVIALLPAIGFLVVYNRRMTGIEVGGKDIWWNDLRPAHSLFYFSFAYLAITGRQQLASFVLLFDVLFGIVAFIHHYDLKIS
jgi:hypothetical protein